MKRALEERKIGGIETTVPFHQVTLEDAVFKSGRYTTDFVEKQNIVAKVREEKRRLSQKSDA